MIKHIQESCGLSSTEDTPTTLFEDNVACIAQITGGYIKSDRIKHISPKFFYTHELHERDNVDIQQKQSSEIWQIYSQNVADIDIQEAGT